MTKRIFPRSFYNTITIAGAVVASVAFGLIVFLTIVELFAASYKPYMGILTFVILPGFLLIGIGIMFIGVLRFHRRERLGKVQELVFPIVDLNKPQHRRAVIFISGGSLLLLVFSAFGSFKAYEYTDSDEFCGEVCHKVMEPEYTAYQYSPHARVGCVKCHIGPGAGWFVRSKLSGAYQVYAVLLDKYPRPIPTPIHNLRPAQETCEQCHWPKHFFSQKKMANTYYLSDEQNTRWDLNLLIRIGGGNIEAGPTSGIHWHMNIANEVTYVATDSQRLEIPWVRVRHDDGVERIYRDKTKPISEKELASGEKRRMDCIDCHNRPTHVYRPPQRTVDRIISLGWIDPSLPYVKSVAVQALENAYTNKAVALDSIRLVIESFYRTYYPEVSKQKKKEITRAISEVQKIYSRNYFPEMKHDWRQYPDHIGHLFSPGCFRCHDGNHVSDDGKVLSRDCNTCHVVLSQELGAGKNNLSLTGVDWVHPVDVGNAWKEMNCSDCHGKTK